MRDLARVGVMIVLILPTGCGEPAMKSTYKAKPLEVVVTLPDIDAAVADVQGKQEVVLPFQKKFEIRGRILNLPRATRQNSGLLLKIEFQSPAGLAREGAILETAESGEGTLEFRGAVMPLRRQAPHQIVIRAISKRTEFARFPAVVKE